jgi:hypothetical protein
MSRDFSTGPRPFFIVCFAPAKNTLLDFQKQRYIGIFMSLRESARAREEREKEKERENEREKKRKKERTKVCAIILLSRRGQTEKSANLI